MTDPSPLPPPSGTFDRSTMIERLRREQFDVLVIGAGITGAGVALDAASRGLRVALVERDDVASGTSSKSSKLVHGGLRYLQQKEFRLVYEALAERQRLLRNAPHLVEPLPFLIPLFGRDGVVQASVAKAYGTALWLYDLTGGLRIGKRHRRISRDEALRYLPTLRPDHLVAAFLYYDAQADDARLTLTIARTAAVRFGAVVANHAGVTALRHDGDGHLCGAELDVGGERLEVDAATVVNATGVWTAEVAALSPGADVPALRPAKGVHISVPWSKVRNEIAAVLPVKADRRSVFVVRWDDRTYIGTTDTDYDGPLDDPQCTDDDIAYLLEGVNASLAEPLGRQDVIGTWAGLRPLVADAGSEKTADLSRRHRVSVDDAGLVTVTGGKLTTYRRMAADTVDVVLAALGRSRRGRARSRTARLPLLGAEGANTAVAAGAGLRGADGSTLPIDLRTHLADRYGGEARQLYALIEAEPSLAEPLVPTLPYCRAEAVHAVREEMATDLHDVLDRRLRARLLARDATADAADDVAALVAPHLGWSAEEAAEHAARYRAALEHERDAAGLAAGVDGMA